MNRINTTTCRKIHTYIYRSKAKIINKLKKEKEEKEGDKEREREEKEGTI